MNILVCVKQVPDTTAVKIDPVTNTLIRDGVPSILNPFDGFALEMALRMKEQAGGTVTLVSMGPPQAENALRDGLAVGADDAFLVSGREFGGSDTLATSYILSCAVKAIEGRKGEKFDVIFCGKQAIDGDTAQVGPELAEHLGYPQVTYGLEAELDGDMLKVKKEVEEGVEVIGVKFPCLVTYTKPAWDPRYPTIKRKMAANRAEIPVLGDDAFPDIDTTRIGLKGSPTNVKKTFVPQKKTGGVKIKEADNETSAKKLFELLSGASII